VFGNPTLNSLQAARWLEESGYAGCPILRSGSVNSLFDYYRQEHNLYLKWDQWVGSLIQIALPFAKRRVLIMAPNQQAIPAPVFAEARARRIKLEFLPLSQFSTARIDAIRHQYLVRPKDADSMEYSDELRAAFGEPPEKHLDLLPQQIRAQLELVP
jgi:hypothetical protein